MTTSVTTISRFMLYLVVMLALASQLVACGGKNDPIAREVNEELDVDIEDFDTNYRDVYPGDKLKIRWESSGAFLFDARVFLSDDAHLSEADLRIIDEECSPSINDHCRSGSRVEFECRYFSDNVLECEEDDDFLSDTDLTEFFDQLPKDAYLILELCNHGDCESRSRRITFF